MTRLTIGFAAVLLFGVARAEAVSFKGLGYLPGGSGESFAHGVPADGSVVVGWSKNASGKYGAFRWTETTEMDGLGQLVTNKNSNAYDVSADGSVVVGQADSGDGLNAIMWTELTGMVQLAGLPGGAGLANAVSDDGSVAAGYYYAPGVKYQASRWAPGLELLSDLPGGDFSSASYDVSADGSVVVGQGNTEAGGEAFRWEGGVMSGLGYLLGGSGDSLAYGISADGSVVVGHSNSPLGTQAFRWTEGTGMVGLGALWDGSFVSKATGVSADGSVVVGNSHVPSGENVAFIWDAASGMRDVRDILVAAGVDLSGWIMLQASAVSGDGRTIVGIGSRAGSHDREAWMAGGVDPVPEPSTLMLLAMGTLALTVGWWRRRRAA